MSRKTIIMGTLLFLFLLGSSVAGKRLLFSTPETSFITGEAE